MATTNYDPRFGEEFWALCDRVETYLRSKNWGAVRSDTQRYIGFKINGRLFMGVSMRGGKGKYRLDFKVPETAAVPIQMPGINSLPYEHRFQQAPYLVSHSAVDLTAFDALFLQAYRNVLARD